MKNRENMPFLLGLWAVGRGVRVKRRLATTKPNEINGFVHKSYRTALKVYYERNI